MKPLAMVMRTTLLAGLLAVLTGSARGAESFLPGIVGDDDRTPLDSESWPWQALGRVNQAAGLHCTGALIAKDAVLTAAHCLMDRLTGAWLDASTVVFAAGYRRGEAVDSAHGREILHPAQAVDPRHPSLQDVAADWAVLYLEHPLHIRPIPVHPLPPEGSAFRFKRAGYSQDRPHLLSLHDGCALLARLDGGRVLFTDCDSTHGDSGSPLLLRQGKKTWIVGITSAVVARGLKPGSYAVDASVFAASLPQTGALGVR